MQDHLFCWTEWSSHWPTILSLNWQVLLHQVCWKPFHFWRCNFSPACIYSKGSFSCGSSCRSWNHSSENQDIPVDVGKTFPEQWGKLPRDVPRESPWSLHLCGQRLQWNLDSIGHSSCPDVHAHATTRCREWWSILVPFQEISFNPPCHKRWLPW